MEVCAHAYFNNVTSSLIISSSAISAVIKCLTMIKRRVDLEELLLINIQSSAFLRD